MTAIQAKTYYNIQLQNDQLTIEPAKDNKKPLVQHGALHIMKTLHKAVTSNVQITNHSARDVSQLASMIFVSVESKYCMLGRVWDNIKQLFGCQTERGEITKLYQAIISHTPQAQNEAVTIKAFYKMQVEAAFVEFCWSVPTLEPLTVVSDEVMNGYMDRMCNTCKNLARKTGKSFIDLAQDSGFSKAKKLKEWFSQHEAAFANHFDMDEQECFHKWSRYLFLSLATNFILQNDLPQASAAIIEAETFLRGIMPLEDEASPLEAHIAHAYLKKMIYKRHKK
jgi:hypothetical protein